MTGKVSYIIYIILGAVLLCSCSTIKLPHGTYKNIEKRYDYKSIDCDNCKVNIYRHNFLFSKHKKLNGKYCINHYSGLMCAEFIDGILNGKYFVYEKSSDVKKNILTEKGNYINGLLDGVNYWYFDDYSSVEEKVTSYTYEQTYKSGYVSGYLKVYEDNHLIRKATYKNSVKDGYEYYFSKEGDTLDIVHYIYDSDYISLKRISDIKINFYTSSAKSLIEELLISHQYIEGKFYTESGTSYISESFSFTPLSLVKYDCDFLIPHKEGRYFIFVIVGNGKPFYDLYLIYPHTVMRLGYIHKDDLK